MPLRILVVSQYCWPENLRINELCVELVKRGNAVTVLTGWPNYPDGTIYPDFRARPGDFASFQGVEVVRVPIWPRQRNSISLMLNYLTLAASASLFGAWRLRGRPFDVVFVFGASPVTQGFPGVLFRRLKRAPLIYWVLDQWPESLAAVGVITSNWALRVVGWGVSFIYNHCDSILAQSHSLKPLISKYTRNPERVGYFPNWSEGAENVESAIPAPEVPPKDGVFNVMYAGNIGATQDFGAVLDAATALRGQTSIRWLIVGDGRVAPWVREEISLRGLEDSVLMLGRHPIERMPSFFRHADALLLSLRDDPVFALTVPGKLQAYLAAGIPIIGMLNGEGSRIIEESQAGISCAAGDSAGLAAAVLRMAGLSPEERAGMSQRGRAFALQEFDRQRLVENLDHHMQDLVRANKRKEGQA
jgi:glycosyltransferase involved in cell wall biosynthesis